MIVGLTLLAGLIVLYAALALRLGRWSISMPMVFVATGFILGAGVTKLLPIFPETEGLERLTEITLALILFGDASTLNLRQVREDARLPLRLLTVGLLLTIAAGTLVGLVLLPAEGMAFAALLGAILAPTDAALGLPLFNNPHIPVRIRRALNVESGLNDGVVTPFVTLFLAFAVATEEHTSGQGGWLIGALVQIALAVALGAATAVLGGWFLGQAARRGWASAESEKIAILALALVAYLSAVALGANGFIAAFTGGLVFGRSTSSQFAEPTTFTETFSTFLSLLVWTIFGAVLLPMGFRFTTDWRPIAFAILSLTLVRMVPVAVALIGARLRSDTCALMGWFGPRGLASVVFTLLAIAQFGESQRPIDTLVAAAAWTILLSVLAHGLSAQPLSMWYARRLEETYDKPAELRDLSELRQRHHVLSGRPRSK